MTLRQYISTLTSNPQSRKSCISCRHCGMVCLVMMILSLGHINASAQKRGFTEHEKDSTAFFNGLSVSVDLFGAVQRMVSDYGQYEAALHINLKDRYFPAFELGIGEANHKNDPVTGISTETRALYGRIGCDFNIAKHKHDDYRIYVGARYAFSPFNVSISHEGVTDPVWGGKAEYSIKDESCYAHWAEALFAVDAKIWGPVRLGWSVRYRQRLSHKDSSMGDPWYTPGFGKSDRNNIGGTFNFTLEL